MKQLKKNEILKNVLRSTTPFRLFLLWLQTLIFLHENRKHHHAIPPYVLIVASIKNITLKTLWGERVIIRMLLLHELMVPLIHAALTKAVHWN